MDGFGRYQKAVGDAAVSLHANDSRKTLSARGARNHGR